MPPKYSNYRKRYSRKTSNKKLVKKTYVAKKSAPITLDGVKKLIKNVNLKQSELKTFNRTIPKVELYHNSTALLTKVNDDNAMPLQGITDNARIGDKINISGFKLRFLMGQKADRQNVTWKIIIVKCQGGVTQTQIFTDTTTGNVMLDPISSDACKVLKVLYLKPNQSAKFYSNAGTLVSQEYTFFRSLWIPIKQQYTFRTNNGTSHDKEDIRIYIQVYDAFGSLTTDNIGYIQAYECTYFRDP